jgi:UPF0755 protein
LRAAISLLLILFLAGACLAGYLWYSLEKPYGTMSAPGVFVEIPHGASRRAVSHILRQSGIIRSAIAFEIYARRHPRRTLVAGEYFFDHPLTGKDAFWKLANGEIFQQPFTVHEGDTIFDIAANLEAEKYMKASDFLAAARDASQILDLAPGARTLEGFLFPATYSLPHNGSAMELTTMMVRNFRETVQRIAPQLLTEEVRLPASPLFRTVTLASLVESETPKADERPVVAGVYTNRYSKGMLLQCDPTVVYALKQENRYRPPLTLNDLRTDSPYNTYTHTGYPPGPIGNPGETSLRAALHPAETDYLYFVANTQGGHFFASTLAEHNQNVAKYHRLLNGQPTDPPADTPHPSHAGSSAQKGKR